MSPVTSSWAVDCKVCEKFKKTCDDHKLTFIVLHPHGFSKQVSIGQWVEKRQEGHSAYKLQFSYTTTCTCSGSSGGPINIHFAAHITKPQLLYWTT
ncbi:hypothetical protein BgiMline_027812 [Biomphalaria glabrata]|nr:hypothetical protein BgiMline_013670 [Biomphalaria glabrata]